MVDDPHVLDSIPAYALGSLDQEEARRVAEHVAVCATCRAELREYESVAGQLGLMAPEASPPPELKLRLMERIRAPGPARAPSRRWTFPRSLVPVGGIAALLLIVILLISNFFLWQRLNRLEVLSGPLGMRAIALQNTVAAPDASGFVVISADGQNGVLVVDELPALDPQREYQLWLVRDEQSTSGAVFSVDESGYRGLRIEAPETLLAYSAVRITIEPAGGSNVPIGEQVLGGSLFNP
jgi:anti-sigma-K factor RskA